MRLNNTDLIFVIKFPWHVSVIVTSSAAGWI